MDPLVVKAIREITKFLAISGYPEARQVVPKEGPTRKFFEVVSTFLQEADYSEILAFQTLLYRLELTPHDYRPTGKSDKDTWYCLRGFKLYSGVSKEEVLSMVGDISQLLVDGGIIKERTENFSTIDCAWTFLRVANPDIQEKVLKLFKGFIWPNPDLAEAKKFGPEIDHAYRDLKRYDGIINRRCEIR